MDLKARMLSLIDTAVKEIATEKAEEERLSAPTNTKKRKQKKKRQSRVVSLKAIKEHKTIEPPKVPSNLTTRQTMEFLTNSMTVIDGIALRKGDGFHASGGPMWIGEDGMGITKAIPMNEEGPFIFLRLEGNTLHALNFDGVYVRLYVGPAKPSKVVPSLINYPYKITRKVK